MDPVPLLQKLVAIDSTSSCSNLPVLDLLEEQLRALSFETWRLCWRDAAGMEKGNLVGRRGPDAPGGLALVGHTDCVPFDPQWEEALAGRLRGGRLYGRGASDTKGSIAAMVAAAARARRHDGPLWMVFTADEEVGCLGAKRLAAEGRLRPRWAIVGEPSGLAPIRAHKGYAGMDVEVIGTEGHSAYPDAGASAIHAAGRLLAELERIQEELARSDSNPDFQPPYTTFHVGLIHGGKARNVLAGSCSFTLDWRPIPGQDPQRGLELFEQAAARLEAAGGGKLHVAHGPPRFDLAATTPAGAEIIRFLEAESGRPCCAVSYGTELPELIELGAEACVFGPGDIRVAHRTGEYVEVAELERAARILEHAVGRFAR